MSEFTVPDADQISEPRKSPSSGERGEWFTKPIILGLSLPWLASCILTIAGAGWYLFAPDGNTPTGGSMSNMEMLPVQPNSQMGSTTPINGFGSAIPEPAIQPQEDVAKLFQSQRSYSEANREAIQRLSETVKAQSVRAADAQQQLIEAQAQITLLSARLAKLETKPAQPNRPRQSGAVAPKSPVSEMRLSAIQTDMAWVYWQDRTWAVQVGDSLGPVTITGIDAGSRKVRTSAGILQ